MRIPLDHSEHCHDGMGVCLLRAHVEGWPVSSDGYGRKVRCADCRDTYFISDPMDEPEAQP
jgi:hypothetical protein